MRSPLPIGDSFTPRSVEPGTNPRPGIAVSRLPKGISYDVKTGVVTYTPGRITRLVKALKNEDLISDAQLPDRDVLIDNHDIVILGGLFFEAFRLRPDRFEECIRREFWDCFEVGIGKIRGEFIVLFVHSSAKQIAAGSGLQGESRHLCEGGAR